MINRLWPFGLPLGILPPPPALIPTPLETLMQFPFALELLYGADRQAAALYLFQVWADLHGSDSGSVKAELRQFARDVQGAISPRRPRGRPRTKRINRLKQMQSAGMSDQAICRILIKGWRGLTPAQRSKKRYELFRAPGRRKPDAVDNPDEK